MHCCPQCTNQSELVAAAAECTHHTQYEGPCSAVVAASHLGMYALNASMDLNTAGVGDSCDLLHLTFTAMFCYCGQALWVHICAVLAMQARHWAMTSV